MGLVLASILALTAAAPTASPVDAVIESRRTDSRELYRWLHAHPELSHQETKTAARIAEELRLLGLEVKTGVGRTGVVAVLRNGKGPTVMVRSEMDGLPIQEETGLDYASEDPGVMHACGHDLHMASFVGVAHALTQTRDRWAGTLVMVAQPAEEVGDGAKAMIRDGLFSRFPKPDYGLGLHGDSNLRAGELSVMEGFNLAAVDAIDVIVKGQGGHGAAPHTTVDPVVLSAQLVLAYQTLVSRVRDPTHDVVLSIGSIHGGTKHNIIPDEVALQLTLRTYEEDARAQILRGIRRITRNLAKAAGAKQPPEIRVSQSVPALYNDPELTDQVKERFGRVFGDSALVPRRAEMYAEDFAFYGREGKFPTMFFFVGSQSGKRSTWGLSHTARYAPDFDPTYKAGVRAMVEAVYTLLPAR